MSDRLARGARGLMISRDIIGRYRKEVSVRERAPLLGLAQIVLVRSRNLLDIG
ncbi:MAG: hypothetical protein QF619_14230 [Candidatus Binatia bacterium]|nr:hypothetical protein [Candidatus Binatia bacterium]